MSDSDLKSASSSRRRRRSKSDSGRNSERDSEKYLKLKNQVTVGALLALLAFGLVLVFMGISN